MPAPSVFPTPEASLSTLVKPLVKPLSQAKFFFFLIFFENNDERKACGAI